ncbi:MAG: glycosyltransferase [Nostoc sp.]|uniref:CgeB family protein n=1 Tax=Nostoc sp. TaxID=1180 RepID=UPI002FF8F889
MSTQLLLIGNTSSPGQIGEILLRAANNLNCCVETVDNHWLSYAPSMKSLWGRLIFKVLGKRPLEWMQLNRKIVHLIQKQKPDIVLVVGVFPLSKDVFNICKVVNAKTINYLTDYPWNRYHYSRTYIENLKSYDLVASTKSQILLQLNQHAVNCVKFLPFAFDPYIHYPPEEVTSKQKEFFDADVAFIGTGDYERLVYLSALIPLKNWKLKIYGGLWEGIPVKNWAVNPIVLSEKFRLATYCSKLTLGIVRKRNKDESTMRTFEIAACGGCGIYEDTQEHREILAGYPDHGFFSSPEDLANKCKWLLENPIEREQMRKIGMQIIIKDTNTYTSRLKTILELCSE